jgi:hypothetical protein
MDLIEVSTCHSDAFENQSKTMRPTACKFPCTFLLHAHFQTFLEHGTGLSICSCRSNSDCFHKTQVQHNNLSNIQEINLAEMLIFQGF